MITVSFTSTTVIGYMCLSCTFFRVTASYLSKVADFYLSHLHLAPPPLLGVTPVEFQLRSLESENVCRCLRDSIRLAVSVEHPFVTDRRTDRHDDGIHRVSVASRVKKTIISCILLAFTRWSHCGATEVQ